MVFALTALAVGLSTAPSWTHAQQSERKNTIEARVVGDPPNRLGPGEWGALSVLVSNYEDVGVDVDVIVSFTADKGREFTRTVWAPPQSHRRAWIMVQAPNVSSGNWVIRSRFIKHDKNSGGVVQRLGTSDALFEETLMSPNTSRYPTLVYMSDQDPDVSSVYSGIQKVREAAQLEPLLLASSEARPASPAWLDSISMLVIAEDVEDPSALSSIRRWVRAGGRVWVMMDRVKPETIAALFGDGSIPSVVGRETVSELAFQRLRPYVQEADRVSFDDPAEICCTVDTPGTVMCTANGWPAAVMFGVNNGQVILTMVETAAWPLPARSWLGGAVFEASPTELAWPEEAVTAALFEQLGQEVPSRSLVMGILGGLGLIVIVGGVWLWRHSVLERLVWLIPTASLAAAAWLVGLGVSARSEAPSTVATMQVAQASPGTGQLNIRGTTLHYSNQGISEPLSGQATIVRGSSPPPRMRSRGDGYWKWEGQSPPPGSRIYQVTDEARSAVRVTARLTENGLEGTVFGAPTKIEDAVVANHGMPSLSLQWEGDQFQTGEDQMLGLNQHIPASIVSDSGRRRQQVLSQLWSGDQVGWRADSPLLAFWSEPWPDTVQWPTTDRTIGDALTVVPIELQPTPAGSKVKIPGPLLRLQTKSSLFSLNQQRWVGHFNGPSKFNVSFELPPTVSALNVEATTLQWKVTAPARNVIVRAKSGKVLHEVEGPTGVTVMRIEDAEALAPVDGSIVLDFEIAAAMGRAEDSQWSIEYMLLHVEGTVE